MAFPFPGGKHRPDEKGIRTHFFCDTEFLKVRPSEGNIYLMKKGLGLYISKVHLFSRCFEGNIDLMKKGLGHTNFLPRDEVRNGLRGKHRPDEKGIRTIWTG